MNMLLTSQHMVTVERSVTEVTGSVDRNCQQLGVARRYSTPAESIQSTQKNMTIN